MNDPAVGRSRAERAFGPKVKAKKAKVKAKPLNKSKTIRNTNVGQFSGPRPSYVPYNVSEQASDILNRSLNKKTR